MPAIVEFPTIVTEAIEQLADLFPNEPARRHFAEYPTGLIVADRKPVEIDGDKQWFFTKAIRIDGVDHPVRIVILWQHRGDKCPRVALRFTRGYNPVPRWGEDEDYADGSDSASGGSIPCLRAT